MKKVTLIVLLFISIFEINAQSPTFQWARQMGSKLNDYSYGIVADVSGNVYTAGYFQDTLDFDPGVSTYTLIANGNSDIFISKLDATGNFVWAKTVGSNMADFGADVKLDNANNVYVTGYFSGLVDFDPGVGTYTLSSFGNFDIFVLKLDASGNFIWARNLGGPSGDIAAAITIDASSNVYTTGNFQGTADFDPGVGTYTLSTSGSNDVYVSKLDASGNFVWAKQITGASTKTGISLTFDPSGNIYSIGHFQGTADFDPGVGTYTLTSSGNEDIFILKLDGAGNFVWAKQMGGIGTDFPRGITVDQANNVCTTGNFASTVDFDPGAASYPLTCAGPFDIFVSKLDANGNFIWAEKVGGGNADVPFAIKSDALNNLYLTGYFNTTADFDPGAGVFNLTSVGLADIFILKLNTAGNFIWAQQIGSPITDFGTAIALDGTNNIYTTGYTNSTCDYDPSVATYTVTSNGASDFFVHKMSQGPVGINEISANSNDFKIYPNPTNGMFYFDLKETSVITIVNVFGQEVYKGTFYEGKQAINLQNFASGIYFVRLCSENDAQAVRLIKE